MADKEQLSELLTATRPGDKVLRRRRRPRGIFQVISRSILNFVKGISNK